MAGVYMKQGRTDLPTLFLRNLRFPPQFKLAPWPIDMFPPAPPVFEPTPHRGRSGGAHARDSDTPHAEHNIILIAINIATLTGRTTNYGVSTPIQRYGALRGVFTFILRFHGVMPTKVPKMRPVTPTPIQQMHHLSRWSNTQQMHHCLPGTGPSAPRMIGDTW
jgi:hypothetical protein